MLVFSVEDMTCGHCVAAITKAVQAADPAARVEVRLDQHQVQVDGATQAHAIEQAIRDAGYTPKPA